MKPRVYQADTTWFVDYGQIVDVPVPSWQWAMDFANEIAWMRHWAAMPNGPSWREFV